jgi:acetyltransferase
VGRVGETYDKPVVCHIAGGGGIRAAARALHAHSIPHYLTPARSALGLGVLWKYAHIKSRPRHEPETVPVKNKKQVIASLEAARSAGEHVLDSQTGTDVAIAYGLQVPPSGLASTAEDAVALAEQSGYPVALKRVAPGVVHKADVGGVILGLADANAVRTAFTQMVGAGEQGFVQRMAPEGGDRSGRIEVIVGAQRDPQFGPLLMFGLGGTYVEVLRDVAFRLAPLSAAEAREMVMETAAGKLLAGVRGQPPSDIDAVIQALVRVSQLMVDLSQVAEVDLNPLIVGQEGEGAWAVDVRIVLE